MSMSDSDKEAKWEPRSHSRFDGLKKKNYLFDCTRQVLGTAPAISFTDQGWNLGLCIGSAES